MAKSVSFSETIHDWLHALTTRYQFKFVLPTLYEAVVEGVRLDLASFSPKVRNRIVNLGYEASERQICDEFLAPEDSVLELGGGIGFVGLYCQTRLGIRDYVTVEANPLTAEILKRNYDLNGRNPRLLAFAIAGTSGMVEMNVGGDFWENHITDPPTRNRINTIQVPGETFSQIYRMAGSRANTLIIDIEGAEQFIDFGALPRRITKIILEWHPKILGEEMKVRLSRKMETAGFRLRKRVSDTECHIREEESRQAPPVQL